MNAAPGPRGTPGGRRAGTVGSRHTGTIVRSRGAEVEPLPSSPALPAVRPARPRRATRRSPAALLAALVVGGVAAATVIGTQTLPSADAGETVAVADLL